jgi:ribonuclease-3
MRSSAFSEFETALEYRFANLEILATALRHRSFVHEQPGPVEDNERLEFLGDAVLNLIVSHLLMNRFPGLTEGDLSRVRSGLVNENRLAAAAKNIRLGRYLQLGKGEQLSRGQQKHSILADAFEALVAAIYLDGGFARAFEVISRLFAPFLDAIAEQEPTYDFKSLLQEYAQSRHQDMPIYEIIEQSGPDHDKTFRVAVTVSGFTTHGTGKNKKGAEQDAAKKAYLRLTSGAGQAP